MGVPIIYKYSYASVLFLYNICTGVFDDWNSSVVFSELLLTFYILPLVGYATIFYCEIWHLRVFQ